MSLKAFYSHLIKRIYVHRLAGGDEVVKRARAYLDDVPFILIDSREEIPTEHLRGTSLYLCRHQGNQVGSCPGSRGHLCCNYRTVDLYSGCSLGCTYCIMRSYLNFSPVTVYVDPAAAIEQIQHLSAVNADESLRIGTGEIGDSLLFDPIFRLSEYFVTGLAGCENVLFEMKTKTSYVDHLLSIHKKGNAVIGFSLNPPEIGRLEEGITSPVEERLKAAGRAVRAGYRLSFHFDPVFRVLEWESLYKTLIQSLKQFPRDRVAWVSFGTIRYTPNLKEEVGKRPYLYDEFVPSKDGKFRYLQKIRVDMYRQLVDWLKSTLDVPAYLCMESKAVWRRVFGRLPHEMPEIKFIFGTPP